MKLCSRLFVLYCRNCPKDDKFRYVIPGGGVEPWLMARWKVRVEFLLSVIGLLFFYLLRLRRYKANGVKTRCYQERVGQFERRFQGEGVVPGKYYLVSRKLKTFCYPTVQTAPCYVPSFWHNTGGWRTDRQTDGRTDRRNCRSYTALAERRAVKTTGSPTFHTLFCSFWLFFVENKCGDGIVRPCRCLRPRESFRTFSTPPIARPNQCTTVIFD